MEAEKAMASDGTSLLDHESTSSNFQSMCALLHVQGCSYLISSVATVQGGRPAPMRARGEARICRCRGVVMRVTSAGLSSGVDESTGVFILSSVVAWWAGALGRWGFQMGR